MLPLKTALYWFHLIWERANPGTYTIMEWDGTVTNPQGLAFHQDVDTDVWSFNVDVDNKRLTVTAQDTDSEYTAITVDSIDELRKYLDRELPPYYNGARHV